MSGYIKKYDKYIKSVLENSSIAGYDKIIETHLIQIRFLQHERIIHLLVTLFFALFLFISFAVALFTSNFLFYVISFILMVVLIFYIFHYYLLENTVQRWYDYYNILNNKKGDSKDDFIG
ncbi:MAG: hypothetical protein K0S55_1057 [Clostridia bacterium]|nr:hypothetical protein [Clostridia bacterium]